MAENKKSFVAYCDWGETFDNLTDEQAGKLAKHLFNYVRDNEPKSDELTELLFISIRQSLKRDLKKYEQYVDKQKLNGAKGGRPKKPKETQITQAFISKPKKADSVNENENENDINKIKEILLNDQYAKELFCMNHSISIEQFNSLLNKFVLNLQIEGVKTRDIKDFKKHFNNWLPFEIKKGLNGTKYSAKADKDDMKEYKEQCRTRKSLNLPIMSFEKYLETYEK